MSVALNEQPVSLAVPLEEAPRGQRGGPESYDALVSRLSHQSVVKHFDAYGDIAWDSDAFRIDPDDVRWELSRTHVLGETAWYRAQPPHTRSRIGLHMAVSFMKVGVEFESVLKRGLLEFAATLPNGSPEFRYVYHEVIEEAQHSLMFQEFINRTGLRVGGLSSFQRAMTRRVIGFGREFPELFFLFVLGGEDPIDYVQRESLASERVIHPLMRRIMQIHVTEEARHLCFARQYLRKHVPGMKSARKVALAVHAPIVLGNMAKLMMEPSRKIVAAYQIPREVIVNAYLKNPRHRKRTAASLGKVQRLCEELGILTPRTAPLWRAMGLVVDESAKGLVSP